MQSKILPRYKNLKNMIFIWGSHFSNHNLNLFTIRGNNCVEWYGRLYSYSEKRLVPHLPLTSGFVICLMPANFGLFQTKTFSANQHLILLPHMGTCDVPDGVVQSQRVLVGGRGWRGGELLTACDTQKTEVETRSWESTAITYYYSITYLHGFKICPDHHHQLTWELARIVHSICNSTGLKLLGKNPATCGFACLWGASDVAETCEPLACSILTDQGEWNRCWL